MTITEMLRNPGMTLKGEQLKVLNLPPKGHVLVKGCAGSGKTVMAIARADFLMKQYNDLFRKSSVALFTYNRQLAQVMQAKIPREIKIKISTIDSWAVSFLKKERGVYPVISKSVARQSPRSAREELFSGYDSRLAHMPLSFYEDEISWIQKREIRTLEEYLGTKRVGRGGSVRVTQEDRQAFLWPLFNRYREIMEEKEVLDWDSLILSALRIVEEKQASFVLPFTHDVVDEAQDFSLAKIKLISRLALPEDGSCGVASGTTAQVAMNETLLSGYGYTVVNARNGTRVEGGKRPVEVNTFHAMKGFQYAPVILVGLSAQEYFRKEGNETLRRKLLFVAMTRACKSLTLYSKGEPCKFLREIEPGRMEIVNLPARSSPTAGIPSPRLR